MGIHSSTAERWTRRYGRYGAAGLLAFALVGGVVGAGCRSRAAAVSPPAPGAPVAVAPNAAGTNPNDPRVPAGVRSNAFLQMRRQGTQNP
jgi:hypothetical protein